jgi:hypothetical protein
VRLLTRSRLAAFAVVAHWLARGLNAWGDKGFLSQTARLLTPKPPKQNNDN